MGELMTSHRRLSQAISEGDGISLIAPVDDLDSARAAEADGAESLLVTSEVEGVRDATGLPIIWRAPEVAAAGQADGCVIDAADLDADEDGELERRYAELGERGLECVVNVTEADELETALERLDPEIFLLSPGNDRKGEEALERVLDLLEDVPAGKLAIADLRVTTRDEVAELERAGVDAVIVGTRDIAGLVSAAPPEV
jgi:indole-3-glycerol phosphate synthase